jgi:hypothetical protein
MACSSRFKALRANLKVVSSSARAGAGTSTFCLTRAQSYSILTWASVPSLSSGLRLSSCYSGGGGVTRDDTCHPPALAIGPTIACWCHRQLTIANPRGEELELDLVQMPPWRQVVGHGRPDLPARAHHFGVRSFAGTVAMASSDSAARKRTQPQCRSGPSSMASHAPLLLGVGEQR